MHFVSAPALLLVVSVAVVGVLHTVVPDHWVPITLLARQNGWSRAETSRAALQAGIGHVATTLVLGLAVWFAGIAFADQFGQLVDSVASAALVLFGAFIAIGSWHEQRRAQANQRHGHRHGGLFGHTHSHDQPIQSSLRLHGPELQSLDTGHGTAALSIFEDGVPPRFRFTGPKLDWLRAETLREDGARQTFTFARRERYWESIEQIPEPHGFEVLVTLGHGAHDHVLRTRFVEHAHGPHRHDGDDGAQYDPLYAPLSGLAVLTRHAHAHRHGGTVHNHRHDHQAETAHTIRPEDEITPPKHAHRHRISGRAALILILGSSPMVEGIPAFFAASRYGVVEIAVMAVVFALSTIVTYITLCVVSAAGLQRIRLGPLERYGEMFSGVFICVVGIVFLVWPIA